MNSFELNKILGAILATCLVVLALNIGAGAIFAPEKPAKPGYAIAVKDHGAGEKAAPKEPEQPIEVLLAKASAEKGEATAKQCQACHTFEKGGPNRVGPNLWGIVDRPRASEAGFNYSAAMKAKGGKWTFDELNKFLANPRGYITGTNMSFAGLSRDQQRADLIEFLRKHADSPVPVPKVAENAAVPAAAKPAEAPKAVAPAAAPK
jgi:cytochrome c